MRCHFKLICVILLSAVFSCTTAEKDVNVTISGCVNDSVFENDVIYLVPFKNATAENVDSALIRNGRFTFNLALDSSDVRILRVHTFKRYLVQELLLITEAGEITAIIDKVSSAQGTPQNDQLQEWKLYKERLDKDRTRLRRSFAGADSLSVAMMKLNIDSLTEAFVEYTSEIIFENDNALGKLLTGIYPNAAATQQK